VKVTIDISQEVLAEALKHTRAKTKQAAILAAVKKYNQLRRLAVLDSRIRGTFKDFMTQRDLEVMRETRI
jgi:hypothetical protein